MQPSPILATHSGAAYSNLATRLLRGRRAEDLAYQAMTAAAMAATLISIWLF